MKKIILLVFISSLFVTQSCDSNKVESDQERKEYITIENLGDIHNYLLQEYSEINSLKSEVTTITFEDVYKDFEQLLIESNKYSTISMIQSIRTKSEQYQLLDRFKDIKLDSNFISNMKEEFINEIESLKNTNIDNDVIEVLFNIFNNPDLINIDTMKNNEGYEVLVAYNNVYKASTEYWESKYPELKNMNLKDARTREVIVADAAGAALGFFCGGFMSIVMGAAFSHSYDRCVELGEKM